MLHPVVIGILKKFQKSNDFLSNTTISLTMNDFEELYTECITKIMNDFTEFNANGSGWVLDRVAFTSIHMYNYQPI